MDNKVPTKVAVVGAAGYAGEDLVRLLLSHPHADLVTVTSRQYAGQTVAKVFPKFSHLPRARTLRFVDPNIDLLGKQAEVVFLALPHGVAAEFAVPLVQQGVRVIDLSADFRIRDPKVYEEFYAHPHPAPELLIDSVYGLAEVYCSAIEKAKLIACPGCYPTSILLPLLPLLKAGLVDPAQIIVNSLSGVTGAGRKLEVEYLFAECNESLRPYGVPKHRHLSEIEQEISIAAGLQVFVQFTPHLVPVNRGILTTLCLTPTTFFAGDPSKMETFTRQLTDVYQAAYGASTFVRLLEGKALPDTKNVVGTNFIEIGWRFDVRTGRLIVMSAIDNIVKGTSSQAIQCFNIATNQPETSGLI